MLDNNFDWTSHLIELRRRLIICIVSIGIILIPLIYFANTIYHFIALPLLKNLPSGSQMIAIAVTAPLFVPLKLVFAIAFFIAMPILLFHLWSFIAPGLYQKERMFIWPLLFSSIFLFYLGMIFAYWVIFPLLFHFFTHAAPANVAIMTDIDAYLNFVIKLLLSFGFCFEIPIVVLLLVRTKLLTYSQLKAARRYIIVLAFILGMLFAPPDVFSQTLLALPIWLLYEIGILATKFFIQKN